MLKALEATATTSQVYTTRSQLRNFTQSFTCLLQGLLRAGVLPVQSVLTWQLVLRDGSSSMHSVIGCSRAASNSQASPRFYVPEKNLQHSQPGATFELGKEETHHALKYV